MRRIVIAVLITLGGAGTLWGQNPVPYINQPLLPGFAVPGGPGFTLGDWHRLRSGCNR